MNGETYTNRLSPPAPHTRHCQSRAVMLRDRTDVRDVRSRIGRLDDRHAIQRRLRALAQAAELTR